MKKITTLILLMFLSLVSYGQIISTGFETGMPVGWTVTNNGNGSTVEWAVNNTAILANTGTSSLMVTPETATTAAPVEDWVITSVANLTGIINPKLSFYGKANPAGPNRNSKLEVRISTTNTDFASFTTIATFQDYNAGATNPISPTGGTYGFQELSLLQYSGDQIYVAFVMTNQGVGKTWNIDDVLLFEDCPDATELGVSDLGPNSVTATWTNAGGATNFQIEVITTGIAPTGVPTYTTSTTTTTQNIIGLLPNAAYQYYIRSTCTDNVFGDWIGPFNFETNPLPINLPYSENFEGFHGWRYTNTDMVNKWFVGSATQNGGTKAMYISNDDGVSNAYTLNATTVTHAYRDIVIPANTNEILLSFDYRGQGQAGQDYMRVWSVPNTGIPVAGTQISTTNIPNSIQIEGQLNLTPNYINKQYMIDVSAYAGTTRRIVFEWRNNNSAGVQPPAAVDNVNISIIPCTAPTNLVLTGTTEQTASISWTAPATPPPSYDYYVSQNNTAPTDATVPSGNTTVPSATVSGLIAGTTNYIWVRSNCGPNGTSFWIGYVVVQTNQIPASLPLNVNFEGTHNFQFSNNIQPNYWMVGNATNNGGNNSIYVTNNGQANEYTFTSSSIVTSYRDFEIPGTATEINIQFDFKGMGQTTTDRMRVWLVPTTYVPVAGTATTVGNSNGIQIGLANYSQVPNWTTYNNVVNVAAFAGTTRRIIFEWVNDQFTGVQPPAAVDNINIKAITCQAPSNLVVSGIGQDSATLSWTAAPGTNVASYDYYYSTSNTPPNEATVPAGNVQGETTVTINGLDHSSLYYFWVRSDCGTTDGDSFWLGPISFYTNQVPAEMNFSEGFEGQSGFTLVNNPALPNKWAIGNAVSASGNNSLYISNNEGVSFEYTTSTSNTVSHAYRDITIPALTNTDIAFSFDWRNNGQSNADFMRVWVVPITYSPIAGTQISVANSGGTQLGANYQLNDAWTNELLIYPGATFSDQTIRLVFEWTNNSTSGTQSPAAVDNVEVKILTCPAPIDISVVNGVNGNLNISWTPVGTETQWELVIQETAGGSPGLDPVGSIIVTGNPSYIFTPVVGELYEVYIRAVCSETDNSFWTGPEQFSVFQPPACADLNILPLDLDVNETGNYVICSGETVDINLNADFDQDSFKATTSYLVESIEYAPPFPFTGGIEMSVEWDDTYAPPFELPFEFCFYGNEFSSIQVSSNGSVHFGTNYGTGAGSQDWPMNSNTTFPNPANSTQLRNVIMGVFQDIWPIPSVSPNGSINYQVLGTYPCRALVVNFSQIELFGCNANKPAQNSQIVIYEITNIIEVYVANRESCGSSGHNDGMGVIGIVNADGTQATIPPGRNAGTWETTDEAWRFKPNGEVATTFGWYQDGQLISDNPEHTVTIDESTHFEAVISYPGCGGDDLVLRKGFDVLVTEEIILPQADEVVICVQNLEDEDRGRISDNDDVILSNFNNPTGFVISYYHSQADAETATDPILDPDNYVPATFPEIIHVRVENTSSGCFGTTSFNVREGVIPSLDLQDAVICTNYTLPILPERQSYLMYEVLDPATQIVVTDTKNNPEVGEVLSIGFYKIYVQIESLDGCTEIFSYKVSVIPCDVQKGISPNGDGLNEFLDLEFYMAAHVKIYNRYGTEVYSHGPGYTNQWHGQSNDGALLPSGTYFYNILTPYENFTGWIQLVREQN